MENVGGVDFQAAIGDELQTIAPVAHDGLDAIPWLSTPPDLGPSLQPLAFHAHLLDQNGGPLSQESVGATSTLPQMADPAICRLFRDPWPSDSVSQGLDTQPFQTFVPQNGTSSEGQTLSLFGPSARRHRQLCLPVVQDGEDKVKCTWSGCWSVIKKDNYARHVNEIHLRQFRALCTSCGKAFQRSYMKKNHICPGRLTKHRSSQTMKFSKGV
ncbi:hypothetical protein DEU56DRAFT_470623 [Suillus clintonianus]|uniref:uncharacterized protein n=1 Tax=Suillus clintonianus TaxID=1904413 RepID=UPI001B85D143|nr:uncharacterized protein DEU56DRAFT_470623 [Suillus clintonianus]KAG2153160.1 hypothetical protein DEU56DRAFT_470623 [Suillus clintonianus]